MCRTIEIGICDCAYYYFGKIDGKEIILERNLEQELLVAKETVISVNNFHRRDQYAFYIDLEDLSEKGNETQNFKYEVEIFHNARQPKDKRCWCGGLKTNIFRKSSRISLI